MARTLRHRFIVDELRAAAAEKNEMKLKVIREIISRIKVTQLKYRTVASDEMVIESLAQYLTDQLEEVEFLKHLIQDAGQASE